MKKLIILTLTILAVATTACGKEVQTAETTSVKKDVSAPVDGEYTVLEVRETAKIQESGYDSSQVTIVIKDTNGARWLYRDYVFTVMQ